MAEKGECMKKVSKKLPIIIGIILVVVIAIVGTIVVVANKGHRVIKVDKILGEASLERIDNEHEIYENINLQSEDAVITGQDGQVELLIDSDKHILARENTKFKVVSSGNETKGKLKIELLYGTSLVEIENKLPDGAFFEVETPNATIGVRGTVFETSYDEDENKTVVVVTSGQVEVTTDMEKVIVEAGQSVIVIDDDIEGTVVVREIIYMSEASKIENKTATDEVLATLEKVPNSTITYVAVDGLGKAYGMGVHFQGAAVTVGAEPNPGYHYVGCESDTIEFEYIPSEYWGHDIPDFNVPESGEHVIYVYYAPNE